MRGTCWGVGPSWEHRLGRIARAGKKCAVWHWKGRERTGGRGGRRRGPPPSGKGQGPGHAQLRARGEEDEIRRRRGRGVLPGVLPPPRRVEPETREEGELAVYNRVHGRVIEARRRSRGPRQHVPATRPRLPRALGDRERLPEREGGILTQGAVREANAPPVQHHARDAALQLVARRAPPGNTGRCPRGRVEQGLVGSTPTLGEAQARAGGLRGG